MNVVDYIIIGSGCSGAMASQTLVDAKKTVHMIDGGEINPDYGTTTPNKDFIDIRSTEANQYKYFIGEDAQGIPWGDIVKVRRLLQPASI